MHQTSTQYCLVVVRLALMPINLLDHVIARGRAYGDLNVADPLKMIGRPRAMRGRPMPGCHWVSAYTRSR